MGISNGHLFCALTSAPPELALGFSCYFIINTAINVDFSCEKEIILKLLSKAFNFLNTLIQPFSEYLVFLIGNRASTQGTAWRTKTVQDINKTKMVVCDVQLIRCLFTKPLNEM